MQVSLELGGKSPQLVFESADLEQGKIVVVFSAFFQAVSACTSL